MNLELNTRVREVISDINCQAINHAETGLRAYIQRNNLLIFDDLIINLHVPLQNETTRG